MRKISTIIIISAFISTSAFANKMMSDDSRPCLAVAKACVKAGYTKSEAMGKKFWKGCMKPILLGESVKGASVDAATVKSCRTDKIERMKKEIKELQDAQS